MLNEARLVSDLGKLVQRFVRLIGVNLQLDSHLAGMTVHGSCQEGALLLVGSAYTRPCILELQLPGGRDPRDLGQQSKGKRGGQVHQRRGCPPLSAQLRTLVALDGEGVAMRPADLGGLELASRMGSGLERDLPSSRWLRHVRFLHVDGVTGQGAEPGPSSSGSNIA